MAAERYVNPRFAELVAHVYAVGRELSASAYPCCTNCGGVGAVIMATPPGQGVTSVVYTLACACLGLTR